MIRPLKSAREEFRREPEPMRLSDEQVRRLSHKEVREAYVGEPAAVSFTGFRPRWWSRGPIPF